MSLRLSSAGESHGPALVAIVTGLPAGLMLDRAAIDADLAGGRRFGDEDVRASLERASARHTAVHVAAGGVAKALLGEIGISVHGTTVDEDGLRARIDEARAERDTVGGIVEVRATGV